MWTPSTPPPPPPPPPVPRPTSSAGFWSDSWEEPSGTSPPTWSDHWSEPSPTAPAPRTTPSRAAPPKTVYSSPPPQKSRPQTPPKAKANTKPMPDFGITNVWGWVCSCGVVNRMPTRHCEACVEPRTSATTMLKATHWVCAACGEPNKITRFVCLGCKGARTARDELLRNPQPPAHVPEGTSSGPAASASGSTLPGSQASSGPTPVASTSGAATSPVPSTSGVAAPTSQATRTSSGTKASSPRTPAKAATSGPSSSTPTAKAATAHFLLTEERHLLLASGGYVTRRTREFILPRAFIDHLDSVGSPLLEANWGVVPEQEFRRRVGEILNVLQQNPHFFALASRLMQGALTPALEWIKPEGTPPPTGLHRPDEVHPEQAPEKKKKKNRRLQHRPRLLPLSPSSWASRRLRRRRQSWRCHLLGWTTRKLRKHRQKHHRVQEHRTSRQLLVVHPSATGPRGMHLLPGLHRPTRPVVGVGEKVETVARSYGGGAGDRHPQPPVRRPPL